MSTTANLLTYSSPSIWSSSMAIPSTSTHSSLSFAAANAANSKWNSTTIAPSPSSLSTMVSSSPSFVTSDCDEGSLLDEPNVRIPIITAYAFIFLLCLLGNMFTIIVICIHRSMRTATNFFLANLAFADLLVSIFCILQNMFHIVGSANGHWALGEVVCKLYVMVLHLVPCTGIGILVCVSLEKYIAVLHPLLALKLLTKKFRVCLMAMIWSISFLFNLPYYFTTIEVRYNHLAACTRDMNGYGSINTRDMITISFVVWYCIPLATIAFLYTRIGMVLWNSGLEPVSIRYSNDGNGNVANGAPTISVTVPNNKTNGTAQNGIQVAKEPSVAKKDVEKEANTEMTTKTSAEEANNGNNNDNAKLHDDVTATESVHTDILESRKKIIRLMIAIVCSFAVLTLPHHARLLYTMWTDGQMCNSTWTALLQPFTYLCIFLSSSINPILYAFMSQRFRGAVRDIIKCRSGKPQRKYTRTRTFVSDIPASRSPSLSHLNATAHHQYYLTVTGGTGVNTALLSASNAGGDHLHVRQYSHNSMRGGSQRYRQKQRQLGGSVNNLLGYFLRINSSGSSYIGANFHKFQSRRNVGNVSNGTNKICGGESRSEREFEERNLMEKRSKPRCQYRRRSQSQTEDSQKSPQTITAHRNSDGDKAKNDNST